MKRFMWKPELIRKLKEEWAKRAEEIPHDFDEVFAARHEQEGMKSTSVESKRRELGLVLSMRERADLISKINIEIHAGRRKSTGILQKAPECLPLPEEKPAYMPMSEWIAKRKEKAGGMAWV